MIVPRELPGVMMNPQSTCVLNGGGGAWAFSSLARQLSAVLWIDVSETPREFNYLLQMDGFDPNTCGELFIPFRAMQIAADKRLQAGVFSSCQVPTPETWLVNSMAQAKQVLNTRSGREWCLKFPTGCGATGHRRLTAGMSLPANWPFPLIVQEFIRLEQPEVFRTYVAGGKLFGWVVRRFPAGVLPSHWVAHARGARYESAGELPAAAADAARAGLEAVGLFDSFGCVDLLRRPTGEWVVLEVGTDGLFNHVDRELGLADLEREIQHQIAEAFWARSPRKPWGANGWRPRQVLAALEPMP